MGEKSVIRVSAERYKQTNSYAKEHGITVSEAAEKLIGTAISRLAALSKYGKKNKKTAGTKKKSKPSKAGAKGKKKAVKSAPKAKATKKGNSKPRVKKQPTATAAPAESPAPVTEGTESTGT